MCMYKYVCKNRMQPCARARAPCPIIGTGTYKSRVHIAGPHCGSPGAGTRVPVVNDGLACGFLFCLYSSVL